MTYKSLQKFVACALLVSATSFPLVADAKSSPADIAKAQQLYGMGLQSYQNDDYRNAAGQFMEAAKLHEKNPLYDVFAAESLRYLKQYPSAIRYYTDALDNINKAKGDAKKKIRMRCYLGLSQSYIGSGNKAKALEFADKAIEENKKDYRGHYQKGNIYYEDKATYPEAIKEYNEAMLLDKTQYGPYVKLLKIYDSQGDLEKVIETYKKAVDYRPLDTGMKMALAQVYITYKDKVTKANHYKEAIATLKDLINVEPKNAFAHYYLATLHVLQNEWDEANNELAICNNLNPNLGNRLAREMDAYRQKHAKDVDISVSVNPETNHVTIQVNNSEKKETAQGNVKDVIELTEQETKDAESTTKEPSKEKPQKDAPKKEATKEEHKKSETKTKHEPTSMAHIAHTAHPAESSTHYTSGDYKKAADLVKSQLAQLEKQIKE